MTHRASRTACAVFATCGLSLGLVACGDDDDDVSSGETTSSAPESSTSTTEGSTTTAAPTTEAPTSSPPTSAADCIGTAEGATAESSAMGDVDGDGAPDTLEVVHDGAGTWHLQVTLASGGSSYTQLPSDGVGGMEMIGAADVDSDGKEEIFVQTGSGASTAIIGLFTVQGGCDIERITLDGNPAEFPVGATVGNISGLQCSNVPEARSIIAFSGTSADGQTYAVTNSELELSGTTLTEVASGTGQAGYGDELHTAASTFHCDDTTYGA
jgi:hypothetical protein